MVIHSNIRQLILFSLGASRSLRYGRLPFGPELFLVPSLNDRNFPDFAEKVCKQAFRSHSDVVRGIREVLSIIKDG